MIEDLLPFLDVRQFSAAKPQPELHAVASLEELPRVVDLDLQVVLADLGRLDADFLQLSLVSLGLGLSLFLALGILPLAVIYYAADWRG